MAQPIQIDGDISLIEFAKIVEGNAAVEFAPNAVLRVNSAWQILQSAIAAERHIYGINTGFGALAGRVTHNSDIALLQKNLIYHLATGVGDELSWIHARALMTARLIVLSKGYSGCAPEMLNLIIALLNLGLAPAIPEKGTVGASGDLTPSAHMALALMGEGAFFDRSGKRFELIAAFDAFGLKPLVLSDREGLAIVNGTSAMTGIAAINAVRTKRILDTAIKSASAYADIMSVRMEAWSSVLSHIRQHPGQGWAQQTLVQLLDGSKRAFLGYIADKKAVPSGGGSGESVWPQDPYSLRCLPQIFGAVIDLVDYHNRTVEIELNSVTDNPVIIDKDPFIIHGGNFYGQHVAFASDALVMALIKIGIILERQLARITDENLSKGLPPFLQPNSGGLNSGFMGAQVTASALLAEMRIKAVPASVQSVPTNGNNQDVNTMGTIAARKAASALQDLGFILSIHALAITQASNLLIDDFKDRDASPASHAFFNFVRSYCPPLIEDRPLFGDIKTLADVFLSTDQLPSAL